MMPTRAHGHLGRTIAHVKPHIVLPLAVAALALAGCSGGKPASTTAPPPGAAGAATGPSGASGEPSGEPSGVAPASAAPSARKSGAAPCPVTAITLQKALIANHDVAGTVSQGAGLKDISCYSGWATAVSQPLNMEASVVLFHYDTAKGDWVAVRAGTSGVCRDGVAHDVATHLKGCRN